MSRLALNKEAMPIANCQVTAVAVESFRLPALDVFHLQIISTNRRQRSTSNCVKLAVFVLLLGEELKCCSCLPCFSSFFLLYWPEMNSIKEIMLVGDAKGGQKLARRWPSMFHRNLAQIFCFLLACWSQGIAQPWLWKFIRRQVKFNLSLYPNENTERIYVYLLRQLDAVT